MNTPSQPSDVAEVLPQKRKSRIRQIIVGAVIVLIISLFCAFLWIAHQFGDSMKSWGKPQISLGQNAKKIIEENTPLRPSGTASSFYYYIQGFQDHVDFASYTDKPERIGEIVKTLTGKTIDELDPFERTKGPTEWLVGAHGNIYDPADMEPESKTSFYDVNSIKNGRCFYSINQKKNDYWMIIVDTEMNRIFYMSWNT